MAKTTFHFPKGFLWGTTSSAHQVEGNNNNNWWVWESEPGHISDNQVSGVACDWWGGRWREDLDRAKQSKQNAHRMSIEWSRIQPSPDCWDNTSMDQYREILRGMRKRDITPIICIHHFSDPIWISDSGGWENGAIIQFFQAYVKKVVEALREYTNIWITINAPNYLANSGYLSGDFPPGKKSLLATRQVMKNLVYAHTLAYHSIHEIQSKSQVGLTIDRRNFFPAKKWSPLDRWLSGIINNQYNNFFPNACSSGVLQLPLGRKRVPEAKNTLDFLGIDYYPAQEVAFDLRNARALFVRKYQLSSEDLTDSKSFPDSAEGLFGAIKLGLQFKVPLMVADHGIETQDDELRRRYLIQHLHQVWRAVNFNYPVRGYFYQSLVDNFGWDRGWSQRVGLWELDRDTQKRIKRLSADAYTEICQQNGISYEIVVQYAPQLVNQLFPV